MYNKEDNQTPAIDIPTTKTTHVIATTSSDGHTMLSSIVTDEQGHQFHKNSMSSSNGEYGISPTYYSNGKMVQTSHQNSSQPLCSPVYGDSSRVFFTHNTSCSCKYSLFHFFFLFLFC